MRKFHSLLIRVIQHLNLRHGEDRVWVFKRIPLGRWPGWVHVVNTPQFIFGWRFILADSQETEPGQDIVSSPWGGNIGWPKLTQYPNDGIVLEGQKTLQAKPSAFDRVNVRRLFLGLERQSFIASRYFVYEGNTAYDNAAMRIFQEKFFRQFSGQHPGWWADELPFFPFSASFSSTEDLEFQLEVNGI